MVNEDGFLAVLNVYEYASSKRLVAGPCADGRFFDLNRDFSFAAREPHWLSRETNLRDTYCRIEVESHGIGKARKLKQVRIWNANKRHEFSVDPNVPLELRMNVSPSKYFSGEELAFAGVSPGHPMGLSLVIPVPIALLAFSQGGWAEYAVLASLMGFLVLAATWRPGSKEKIAQVIEAKDRLRCAKKQQFIQNASSLEWWKTLSGVEFENAVAMLFCDKGYLVEFTPRSSDGGVDLKMQTEESRVLVQCKAYGKNVGVAAVRELIGVRAQFDDPHEAWLVSLAGFSKQAEELASRNGIKLFSIAQHHLNLQS